MIVKLEKITDAKEVEGISERFNKSYNTVIEDTNKEVDAINKYLQDLYLLEVKNDGATKGMLDKLMRLMKQGLATANKLIANSKGKDYDVYKFNLNGIPGMLLVSDTTPTFTKFIDHTTIRASGIGISAVYNNNDKTPVRVEFDGIGYPVILSKKELLEALKKDNTLYEALSHEIGYIKGSLKLPNTFKGISNLEKLGDEFYYIEKEVSKDMKCAGILKELESAKKNATEDDRFKFIMGAINLIGINTLVEAKILGEMIKKDPDKSMRIKVLKRLFGTA